jgi:hypothetical protein
LVSAQIGRRLSWMNQDFALGTWRDLATPRHVVVLKVAKKND